MKLSNKILNDMLQAGTLGQRVLQKYFKQSLNIEKKEKAGFVTQADKESEQVITQALRDLGYSFPLLGEETFVREKESLFHSGEPFWILDPIDGTTNFIHGFPVVAISLALFAQGQPQAALIMAPFMGNTPSGEVYMALRGQGAYLNGQKITVTQTQNLSEAFLSTGFFHEDLEQLQEQLDIFSVLVRKARAIRRPGAAAYDLALVASGVFDGFWESGLKPWDSAAGMLLVQEAGGKVFTYKQHPYHPLKNSLVAGNEKIVEHICKAIASHVRSITD